MDQEKLWGDLQERQAAFDATQSAPRVVDVGFDQLFGRNSAMGNSTSSDFRTVSNPTTGADMTQFTRTGDSFLTKGTPSNGYNNTGQWNKTTAFAQGVGTRSKGLAKTDQNFFNTGGQHDTFSRYYGWSLETFPWQIFRQKSAEMIHLMSYIMGYVCCNLAV